MSEATPGRARSGAPTLQDVAREAGVSLATASRVLNGTARRVAPAFREKVEAAAEQLGYTANLSAQATARGSSAIVALLVADIADPYFGRIAAGVARGADEAGLMLTIAITERDPQREAKLVRALRGQRPRSVILAASRTTGRANEELVTELGAYTSAGGSVVTIGPGGGTRSVGVDNIGGGRALGAALAELGYRRAIVVAADEGVRTSDDRIAGLAEGFGSGGGAIDEVLRAGFSRDAGHDAIATVAERIEAGTVVVGISDVVAMGVMAALREHGRTPGEDVAVAGFDDIPTSHDTVPGLTTVHVPLEELGYQALRSSLVADAVEDAPLPVEVVLRGSTPRRG